MTRALLSVLSLAAVVSGSLSWVTVKHCLTTQSLLPWKTYNKCGLLEELIMMIIIITHQYWWVWIEQHILFVTWDTCHTSVSYPVRHLTGLNLGQLAAGDQLMVLCDSDSSWRISVTALLMRMVMNMLMLLRHGIHSVILTVWPSVIGIYRVEVTCL